jgi:hypothetical protein
MAEQYDDPLTALPTVAPPGADTFFGKKKKQPGVESVDDTITENADDYFGNFPGVAPVPNDPITEGPGLLPGTGGMPFDGTITETTDDLTPGLYPGGIPWPGDPVNAVAPPGVAPVDGTITEGGDLLRNFPGLPGGVAPVPGGDQGIPDDGLIPPDMVPPAEVSDQDLLDQYRRYASEALANPSRYDMDLVQQSLAQMDAELADQREQGQASLEEGMAQRGLVGSSVEQNQTSELISDLERQRSGYALGLAKDMAATHAQDRQAAASMASDPLRIRVSQRANELQETGMNLDEAFRQAQFEVQQEMFFGNQGNRDEFGGTFAEDQRRADIDAYYQHLALLSQLGLDEDDWNRLMRDNPPPLNSSGEQPFEPEPSSFDRIRERLGRS